MNTTPTLTQATQHPTRAHTRAAHAPRSTRKAPPPKANALLSAAQKDMSELRDYLASVRLYDRTRQSAWFRAVRGEQ